MTNFEQDSQFYQEKGFAREVGIGKKPAVLVIDMIKGFTDPTSQLGSDFEPVIGQINRLVNVAHAKDIPVIFTTVAYQNEREGGHFVKKVPALNLLVQGSKWVEIDAGIERRDTDVVIEKKYASAFFGTSLISMLTSTGVDSLILTGVTTSGCIRATAVDALQYGYQAIVPEECVADRLDAPHHANLFDIHAKYGDVMPLEKLLSQLDSGF